MKPEKKMYLFSECPVGHAECKLVSGIPPRGQQIMVHLFRDWQTSEEVARKLIIKQKDVRGKTIERGHDKTSFVSRYFASLRLHNLLDSDFQLRPVKGSKQYERKTKVYRLRADKLAGSSMIWRLKETWPENEVKRFKKSREMQADLENLSNVIIDYFDDEDIRHSVPEGANLVNWIKETILYAWLSGQMLKIKYTRGGFKNKLEKASAKFASLNRYGAPMWFEDSGGKPTFDKLTLLDVKRSFMSEELQRLGYQSFIFSVLHDLYSHEKISEWVLSLDRFKILDDRSKNPSYHEVSSENEAFIMKKKIE